jgi:hypothetical protein
MKQTKKLTSKQVGLKYGFRSGLEERVAEQLKNAGIDPKFETIKLPYHVEKTSTYTPDFPVHKTIIIETKGRFQTTDRMKMLLVQKQYPHLDFRFIFTNSNARISKASQTTYAMWCIKNGFKYADKLLPESWIKEIKGEQ